MVKSSITCFPDLQTAILSRLKYFRVSDFVKCFYRVHYDSMVGLIKVANSIYSTNYKLLMCIDTSMAKISAPLLQSATSKFYTFLWIIWARGIK